MALWDSDNLDSVGVVDPYEVLSRPAEGPDIVLRYAEHVDGIIDVFLPPSLGRPSEPAPLLFFVHGGFWRQAWDRLHARPLAAALARRGLVVAVPEYRRVGGAGGWPMTGYDVRDAFAVAPTLIEAAAPGWIEPAAPAVFSGHSAGGHLALWSGLRAPGGRVERIVALAPVSDVRMAAAVNMGDGAVQALLGGGPDDVPDHYAEADVTATLPGRLPVTIIQGTEDKEVTVTMNRALAAVHRDAPGFRYIELDGVEHFALIDPLTDVFETTVWPALCGRV
jgi:acetyl esterase/lipase